MHKQIKVAQIGVGKWGKKLLTEFMKQAEIVGACHSGSPETAHYLKTFGIPSLSIEEILGNNEIEAVVIATPTETHHDFAVNALEANKHIFLEKPGTSNYKELEEIAVEADKIGKQVALGYEFVHHPALRKIVDEIEPEQIDGLNFTWRKWGTFKDDAIPHLASHALSIVKALGFSDLRVDDTFYQSLIGSNDIIRCELQLNESIPFFINIDRTAVNENQRELKVILRKGGLLWQNDNLFELSDKSNTPTPIALYGGTAVGNEVKDFLDAIKNNRKPIADANFGLDVWEIIKSLQE